MKRPREEPNETTQPNNEESDSTRLAKRSKTDADEYERVMSLALEYVRLSARISGGDDRDDNSVSNEAIKQLVEYWIAQYDVFRSDAVSKLHKALGISEETAAAHFDSIPITIDPRIDAEYTFNWSVTSEQRQWQWGIDVDTVLGAAAPPEEQKEAANSWKFICTSITMLFEFVIEISQAFYANQVIYLEQIAQLPPQNNTRQPDPSVRTMADLRQFLVQRTGHPDTWALQNNGDIVDLDRQGLAPDTDLAALDREEDTDALRCEADELECMRESKQYAEEVEDPHEIEVPCAQYSFDEELRIMKPDEVVNPLVRLVEIFATFDIIEQARQQAGDDQSKLASELESLASSEDVDKELLAVLRERVKDRQQLEPYFKVLQEIVQDLGFIQRACVGPGRPNFKRALELWCPIIARAIANRWAYYQGDESDLYSDRTPSDWDPAEDSDYPSSLSETSEEYEGPEMDEESSSEDVDDEYSDSDDEMIDDFSIRHSLSQKDSSDSESPESPSSASNGSEEASAGPIVPPSTRPTGTDNEYCEVCRDLHGKNYSTLQNFWPRATCGPKCKSQDDGTLENFDIETGKSVASRNVYGSGFEATPSQPLMDQNWCTEVEECYVSVADVLRDSFENDSLLPDIIALSRRGGSKSVSAQSIGESALQLREYLHRVIAAVIEKKKQEGRHQTGEMLEIDEDDIVAALPYAQPGPRHDEYALYLSDNKYRENNQDEEAGNPPPQKLEHDASEEKEAESMDVMALPQTEAASEDDDYEDDIQVFQDLWEQRTQEESYQPKKDLIVYAAGVEQAPWLDDTKANTLPSFQFQESNSSHQIAISPYEKPEVQLFVDKKTLEKACPVFKQMLRANKEAQVIVALECLDSEELLKRFLTFLCTQQYDLVSKDAGTKTLRALHGASLAYEIKNLAAYLEHHMTVNITSSTAIDVFMWGNNYKVNNRNLCRAAETFLRSLPEEEALRLVAEARSAASNDDRDSALSEFEWDYLYLACTKITMENVVIKLHDVLQLDKELNEAFDDDAKEELASSYVSYMVNTRLKEQLLWVLMRNFDRISTTQAWKSPEYLDGELKAHIIKLMRVYKYNYHYRGRLRSFRANDSVSEDQGQEPQNLADAEKFAKQERDCIRRWRTQAEDMLKRAFPGLPIKGIW